MDYVVGDTIIFTEPVFRGSYPRSKFYGNRTITAEITAESYGEKRGQHTFTIMVLAVDGADAMDVLESRSLRRKGRTIYRDSRLLIACDQGRTDKLADKHHRGDKARSFRRSQLVDNAVDMGITAEQAATMSIEVLREYWYQRHR